MNNNLKSFIIGALLTVFVVVGSAAAIYTAWRMGQPGPVAPTVPQIKPKAAEPNDTPTPACALSFTVTETPETPKLKCESISLSPTSTNVTSGSETRSLDVTASGGTTPYTYRWQVAGGGSFSSVTAKSPTWTAQARLGGSQSWTISVVVRDADNNTASGTECEVKLNYDAPKVCNSGCGDTNECPSGMVCSKGHCRNPECVDSENCACKVCNARCTTKEECGSDMTCAGGNCRNPSCITQPSCTCPPPVTYVPTQPPARVITVTPTPALTHRACSSNYTCVTVTGAGQDTCTSDASCRPIAAPVPVPKAGVELPTIAVILGGVVLLAIGLLAF